MTKKVKKGGRVRGTPNKKTLDLIKTLQDKNFDPAAKLVEVYAESLKLYKYKVKHQKGWGAGECLSVARGAAADLMQYCYPKRKSIELTGKDGKDLFQSFSDLAKQHAPTGEDAPEPIDVSPITEVSDGE
jgi:hypothetical protein